MRSEVWFGHAYYQYSALECGYLRYGLNKILMYVMYGSPETSEVRILKGVF